MTYWELISGALRLDAGVFRTIDSMDHGLRYALVILLLAGASETAGQAVVLVLNRVSRGRFCLALLLGGVELVVEALLWIAGVWLVGGWLGVRRPEFASAVRVMGLAYAPLVLGIFEFFPYVGPAFGRLLRLWVVLAAVVGISVVFGVPPFAAGVLAIGGFLLRWVFLRVFSRVAASTYAWFWRASTGRAAPLQSTDALLEIGTRERVG